MSVPCHKLVRDRIPEIIQSDGRRPVIRMLDEASYRQALLAKLPKRRTRPPALPPLTFPGELADVLEVLRPDGHGGHVLGAAPVARR